MASFWVDRPVLVTGATGLVGSWLIKRLQEARADVVCLVRDWVPQSEASRSRLLERTRVVRGDVRDQELLERVLGEFEIDTVMFGVALGTESKTVPLETSTFVTAVTVNTTVLFTTLAENA